MLWTKGNTNVLFFFATAVVVLHVLVFPDYLMPLPILFGGFATIIFFIVGLQYYVNSWAKIDSFKTRLLIHSFLYRLVAIEVLAVLTYFYDPANMPMEIHAQDSWNYHNSGTMVADALHEGRSISIALAQIWKSETDYGFATIIGFIYYLFGKNIFLIKLFNAVLGSITVIRIYQITRIIYDERRARLAGILMMLMPAMLWFTGFFLKETVLIFLIVNIGYLTYRIIINTKFRVLNSLVILGFFGAVFYFRVVLAPILIVCVILQILMHKTTSRNYKLASVFISALFIVGGLLVMNKLGMDKHIETAIEASQDQFGNELSDTSKKRGVTYAAAIISPLLIVAAIITPFPSLLNFEAAQIGIYSHFQNEIIRNCLYFFVFIGIINAYKTRNKGLIFIGGFAIIYILVLAASGVSFQDRFQILALPFLIIFMADGIATQYKKRNQHWIYYLSAIFIAILFWNLFKLYNRGLI